MEYTPLRENLDEIRVITILPTSVDGLVRCTIEVVSLTDRNEGIENHEATEVPAPSQYRFKWGDYACLSYTWGDPTKTASIIVNSVQIQVPTNLEACLQTMQNRSMFGARFKVWIDAISINQKDTAERGLQVGKMRELYTAAWSVVIWLGAECSDSQIAIDLLEKLSRYYNHGDKDERNIPNLNLEIDTLRSSLKNDPEYLGRGSWVALREFLSRPYWDRLWIIQEVLISASKTVLCGSRSINWDILCKGIGTIHQSLFVVKNELLDYDQKVCGKTYPEPWCTKNLHRVLKDLWLLGEELKQKNHSIYLPSKRADSHPRFQFHRNPLDIHRLLEISKQSLGSDARDKFYGLLAIVEPGFASQIRPSYDIDAGAAFNMVAKTHIQTYNSLEILREANPWGGNSSASWAPDWTWQGRNRFKMHLVPYNASGNTLASARFLDQDKTLICGGVIIDKIDGLGPRHREARDGVNHAAELWEFKADTMVQPQATSPSEIEIEQLKLDLCRALTRDRPWEIPNNESTWHLAVLNLPADEDTALMKFSARGPGWEYLASERNYYQRWSLWRKAHAEFMICGHRLDEFFTDRVPDNALHDDYSAAYNAAKGSSQAQRLVVTEKNRIGWVTDNNDSGGEDQVMRGDLFCVVFGCSTPIVIRPHLDGFVVLGEGYLQGVMEGEALPMVEDGELCVQDFKFY